MLVMWDMPDVGYFVKRGKDNKKKRRVGRGVCIKRGLQLLVNDAQSGDGNRNKDLGLFCVCKYRWFGFCALVDSVLGGEKWAYDRILIGNRAYGIALGREAVWTAGVYVGCMRAIGERGGKLPKA